MNKKLIEYLIIVTAVILLIYGCYSLYTYTLPENKQNITDSATINFPLSSGYTADGDTIVFENAHDFYNMKVSKLSSSDEKITNLLNHFTNLGQGTIDYRNETCYAVTIEFDDGSGYTYHSMVIPYDSFDKNNRSFTKDTNVYLFEGNNRQFVVDTVFNSDVVL